ncbi:arylacetamide deacetylase-like [Lytechinus variegatus]|uniref:arylacetamide deacetylase-like n=1 Tax=Lytechinus variegatus TaxID=7654 RepID=UPI001BB1C3EC|nr:arylacetamide deacetylase-like [Lytechinus variegatus]
MAVLAVCIGLVGLLALAGILLVVFIMFKLPKLPPEIDSRRKTQIFLIQSGLFALFVKMKGKLNGKNFLVNARESANTWLKPKPSIVTGSTVKSSVRDFSGVAVRFYEPIVKERNDLPGLVFIHGGGFMFGSAGMYDQVTRKMAEVIGGVVISVDYRLAPEHPFPAGFDDCMTATKHFFKHCKEFGVDPTRVAICGDSAGGNLAAGVVQELCYKTNPAQGICRPKLQILLYPLLQMLDLKTPSYQRHDAVFGVSGGFLPTSSLGWMTPRYLTGKKDGSLTAALMKGALHSFAARENDTLKDMLSHDSVPAKLKCEAYATPSMTDVDPSIKAVWDGFKPFVLDTRVMPLYKEDLSRLPPAYIITCDFDVLRDDGVMYAERLKQAGVKAVLDNCCGALHGLLFFPQFKWGLIARKKLYAHLSDVL